MKGLNLLKPACVASLVLGELGFALHADVPDQIVWPAPDIPLAHSTPYETRKPKNIVFILTDDQDAALDSISYMPRLNKHLIKKGTSFVNHFTTTAICCPSRVALWTGKQPHNTNVTDVNPPYGEYLSSN